MKRREAREIAFQLTYEMVLNGEYNPDTFDDLLEKADGESRGYVKSVIKGIAEHKAELSAIIEKYAQGYGVDRIYKTDLAALYVACYEILYTDTPKAVAANEAVEIVKAYSDTKSFSFVNGIIASVIKGESGE